MKNYKTKDFYLSALLVCNDFKLINSEKKKEGVYFIFENYDDDLLQRLITEFVDCQANVNLRKFTSALVVIRKELDKYR